MNKESLYFITSLRSELVNNLNESLTESDKNSIIENFSDGDVLSLSLIGKTIPENENKQAYAEGLIQAFSEMFFEGELQLEIDAENNSFVSILTEWPKGSSETNTYKPYKPKSYTSNGKSETYDDSKYTGGKEVKVNHTPSGFDDSKPAKTAPANTPVNHTPSGFDDPKPSAKPNNTPKPDAKPVSTGDEQSSFQNAVKHFKDFFMNNHGRNLKIGLAVAAASAAAYGAYKLYKKKFGDKNKAKNAQVAQLNKAKSMANKTENPNKFKQMIQDKINKIRRG